MAEKQRWYVLMACDLEIVKEGAINMYLTLWSAKCSKSAVTPQCYKYRNNYDCVDGLGVCWHVNLRTDGFIDRR